MHQQDLTNPIVVRMLNDQMMQLEKIFLSAKSLPLQSSSNHVLLSAQGGQWYGRATFPGLINLFNEVLYPPPDKLQPNGNRDDWDVLEKLRRHVTEIYVMIRQATSHLKQFDII